MLAWSKDVFTERATTMVDSRSILRRSKTLVVVGLVFGLLTPLSGALPTVQALDNGLAVTPPMGFNDWNAFGCNVSAKLIEETADAMVANGMKDAGYTYVTMDDCWMAGQEQPRNTDARVQAGRDANGTLVPDPTNFPDGIKVVADYVHARGLKLGIYEDAGTATCQGLAGSYGHEAQDAQTFAAWGVDYLKYDFCNYPTTGEFAGKTKTEIAQTLYARMRDALAATGRPIVFSMSLALETDLQQQTWASPLGNLWRTTADISDKWESVVSIFHQNVQYAQYASPGAWNDPDMLEVGNGGMTDTEYRSHFSLWAMMAAPLIAGTDLRTASAATLAIYNNTDVIAVDQDSLGVQGTVLASDGTHWTLTKPLANGDKAILFFNEGSTPAFEQMSLASLGRYVAYLPAIVQNATNTSATSQAAFQVRDLWAHTDSTVANTLSAWVPPHGVALFRVSSGTSSSDVAPHVSFGGSASPDFVPQGTSTTVTAQLTNDGAQVVDNIQVALTAPSGWTVTQDMRASSSVSATSTTKASWTVAVPTGAVTGTTTLTVTGTYRVGNSGTTTTTNTLSIVVPPSAPTASAYLSDLAWVSAKGTVERDHSVPPFAPPGSPPGAPGTITIAGTAYTKGLGTQQGSDIQYYLGGQCSTLTAVAGVDDSAQAFAGTPSAEFQIVVDGNVVFDQTIAKGTAVNINQPLTGAHVVNLVVVSSSSFASTAADWADAHVTCGGS